MAAGALIFDLDGTVWDSWPWYAEIAEREGAARDVERTLRAGRGSIARILRAAGIRTDGMVRAIASSGCCPLYDGVRETLETLHRGDRALGAVTNLPSWIAVPMIEALGLTPFFAEIVTYGRAMRPKPHPDPIEAWLHRAGHQPSRDVWYVGDTDADSRAASLAGISFAWAAYGYGPRRPPCDAVIERFSDVLELGSEEGK